jgi:hypothetical protein
MLRLQIRGARGEGPVEEPPRLTDRQQHLALGLLEVAAVYATRLHGRSGHSVPHHFGHGDAGKFQDQEGR